MQLIAMITMLIDHIGLVFFPESPTWRVIGRIAFPIYAYALVLGYMRTSSVRRYIVRLVWIALASQIPFMAAFHTTGVNVVGTLLGSLLVLLALDRLKAVSLKAVIIAAAGLVMELYDFDYASYGLLLVLVYRYGKGAAVLALHFVLNVAYAYWQGWYMNMYNIVSTVLVLYGNGLLRQVDRFRMPKWLWRSFYPLHLAVIAIIDRLPPQ